MKFEVIDYWLSVHALSTRFLTLPRRNLSNSSLVTAYLEVLLVPRHSLSFSHSTLQEPVFADTWKPSADDCLDLLSLINLCLLFILFLITAIIKTNFNDHSVDLFNQS